MFRNGKLANDTSVDSKFYFEDIDGVATRLGIIEVVPIEAQEMKGESSSRHVLMLHGGFESSPYLQNLCLLQYPLFLFQHRFHYSIILQIKSFATESLPIINYTVINDEGEI